MFSVEQLVANETFTTLKLVEEDLCQVHAQLCGGPLTWVTKCEDAVLLDDTWPLDLVIPVQNDRIWPFEVKNAAMTLFSLAARAVAERAVGRVRTPVLPDAVTDWFDASQCALLSREKLVGTLLGDSRRKVAAVYTWEGHALLVMWLTGEASFSESTCPKAFKQLRDSIQALTSIWALATAQRAATVHAD